MPERNELERLSSVLSRGGEALAADFLAVARARSGRWRSVVHAGSPRTLPAELLAECVDREQPVANDQWLAAPLAPRQSPGEVLVAHRSAKPTVGDLKTIDALAAAVGAALASEQDRASQARRLSRLEAILEIVSQWNRTQEMEPLLEQMARAATKLLAADRASIFLWDRPNRTLVGRPALGVEGNELRIPDNVGIVGQVVQSGVPRRVARGEQDQIDHRVDAQLGYKTESILCVPLRGADGERFGAFELINKLDGDFTDDDEAGLVELAAHAAVALETTQHFEQLLTAHRQMIDQAADEVRLVGQSPAIAALRSTIRRVANTDLAILVLGENGTGKEVVAQSIHFLSPRRDQPFIAVNCAAITETLLESELFGHEKGAFTDAHEARPGKFEMASGGTLFLDEIGDLSPGGQAKLLRVLEEKIVVRVGGSKPIHTDARVIAATNQNLAEMVRNRKFREDLYYRLNVVSLELPPLRSRGDDAMLLAEHFLADFCKKARRKPLRFTAAARKRLLTHTWPGNVRELRNLMERLAYLSTGDKLDEPDLEFILSPTGQVPGAVPPNLPLTDATTRFQIDYIKQAIDQSRQNMSDAAERLGLHRSNLYRKMRQLGMEGE